MASDTILIKDLLIQGVIGINDWEREIVQDILINITLDFDLTKSGKSDSIEDTLNYKTLTKMIIKYVEDSSHYLVETLATEIAKICVLNFNPSKVKVRVEKPGALRFAKSVGVEIERSKADFE